MTKTQFKQFDPATVVGYVETGDAVELFEAAAYDIADRRVKDIQPMLQSLVLDRLYEISDGVRDGALSFVQAAVSRRAMRAQDVADAADFVIGEGDEGYGWHKQRAELLAILVDESPSVLSGSKGLLNTVLEEPHKIDAEDTQDVAFFIKTLEKAHAAGVLSGKRLFQATTGAMVRSIDPEEQMIWLEMTRLQVRVKPAELKIRRRLSDCAFDMALDDPHQDQDVRDSACGLIGDMVEKGLLSPEQVFEKIGGQSIITFIADAEGNHEWYALGLLTVLGVLVDKAPDFIGEQKGLLADLLSKQVCSYTGLIEEIALVVLGKAMDKDMLTIGDVEALSSTGRGLSTVGSRPVFDMCLAKRPEACKTSETIKDAIIRNIGDGGACANMYDHNIAEEAVKLGVIDKNDIVRLSESDMPDFAVQRVLAFVLIHDSEAHLDRRLHQIINSAIDDPHTIGQEARANFALAMEKGTKRPAPKRKGAGKKPAPAPEGGT